jgi:hypothetical protein
MLEHLMKFVFTFTVLHLWLFRRQSIFTLQCKEQSSIIYMFLNTQRIFYLRSWKLKSDFRKTMLKETNIFYWHKQGNIVFYVSTLHVILTEYVVSKWKKMSLLSHFETIPYENECVHSLSLSHTHTHAHARAHTHTHTHTYTTAEKTEIVESEESQKTEPLWSKGWINMYPSLPPSSSLPPWLKNRLITALFIPYFLLFITHNYTSIDYRMQLETCYQRGKRLITNISCIPLLSKVISKSCRFRYGCHDKMQQMLWASFSVEYIYFYLW